MAQLLAYDQKLGVSSKFDRQILESVAPGVGVVSPGDLKVTAGSGMGSNIAIGRAMIRGSTNADQGMYEAWNTAIATVTHATADVTNPRIDSIYIKVLDTTEAGGGTDAAQIVIVAGTATVGATLDNRTGAGSPPVSSVLLGDVLIPAGAASSASFTYRDRRPYATPNVVPPIKTTTFDAVRFAPVVGPVATVTANGTTHDLMQSAVLMYLPERVTAARIRWTYVHGATAITGNYVIGIFDASGRGIVNTGSIALTGAANSTQARSETITTTTFEAGLYYVFFGLDGTNAGNMSVESVDLGIVSNNSIPGVANVALVATAGGVTVPTTILGMTDRTAEAGATARICVPIVALATA